MRFINLHTHNPELNPQETAIQNLFLADSDLLDKPSENKFFSIGLHPWHINNDWQEQLNRVKELADNKAILAIGETGLDKKRDADFQLQREVLSKHLELAEELGKPVIWHVVKAYSDVLALAKSFKPSQPWILHGFHAKEEMTKALISKGFYFSFGPMVLNEKAQNTEILKLVPLEKLFFENDDSTIPIERIFEKAATILSLPLEKLKEIIHDNFLRVFGKFTITK